MKVSDCIFLSIICLISISQLLSSASAEAYCRLSEHPHTALVAISEPAYLIQISSNVHNEKDCSQLCCDSDECNAVSFYKTSDRDLCVMLRCEPFKNCTWKRVEGFYAAYVTKEDSQVGNQEHSNDQETTPEPTTTTVATTTTTTTPPPTTTTPTTTTPTVTERVKSFVEPDWNVLPDDTDDWNKNKPEVDTSAPILELPDTTPAKLNMLTTPNTWVDWKSQSQDELEPENPIITNIDNNEINNIVDTDVTPDVTEVEPDVPTDLNIEMEPAVKPFVTEVPQRNNFPGIESPIVLVGIFTTFGLALVLLLAVIRKLWTTRRGKPQYRPLRDYDVHVEPPGSSAALLP